MIEKLNEELLSFKILFEKIENNQRYITKPAFSLEAKEDENEPLSEDNFTQDDIEGLTSNPEKDFEDSSVIETVQDNQDQKLNQEKENYKPSASDKHISVPINTPNKIFYEIQELKKVNSTKSEDCNYKLPQYNKKEQIFCDSFFKHVDERRCFGKVNSMTINPCFTTS